MKGNPALPGGLLKSKPTWSNALGCSATSAFFVLFNGKPKATVSWGHNGSHLVQSSGSSAPVNEDVVS